MSFEMREPGFEQAQARTSPIESSPEVQGDEPALARTELPYEARIELIRLLARQLAIAHGEDPDEKPYPLRHPRWRFHTARAKVLLSISEAEHRALAEVLGENLAQTRTPKPHARLARLRLALGLKRSI